MPSCPKTHSGCCMHPFVAASTWGVGPGLHQTTLIEYRAFSKLLDGWLWLIWSRIWFENGNFRGILPATSKTKINTTLKRKEKEEDLASVEYVSLTGDHWITNHNYLGVTMHHITRTYELALTVMKTEERHSSEAHAQQFCGRRVENWRKKSQLSGRTVHAKWQLWLNCCHVSTCPASLTCYRDASTWREPLQ